eukprot:Gb_36348 [translate_table: standard]
MLHAIPDKLPLPQEMLVQAPPKGSSVNS